MTEPRIACWTDTHPEPAHTSATLRAHFAQPPGENDDWCVWCGEPCDDHESECGAVVVRAHADAWERLEEAHDRFPWSRHADADGWGQNLDEKEALASAAVLAHYTDRADGFIQPISREEYQEQVEELHAALAVEIAAHEADRRRIEVLEMTLHEIAKGEGRFARDPLTHASNTVEDMKALAVAVLARDAAKEDER